MDQTKFNELLKKNGLPTDMNIHVRICTSTGKKSCLANPEVGYFRMWITRPQHGWGNKNRSEKEAGQYIVDHEANLVRIEKTGYEQGPSPRTHCISEKITKLSKSKEINEMLIERHLKLNQQTRGLMKQEIQ